LSPNKILSRQELRQQVANWRERGDSVTLANGCFDLLHVGHVRYLHAAKELGGKLIVAINSDESVRAMKGEGRPLMPAAERAEILASLADVDAVVIFPEPDVRALVREIRPDVQAKGTDYTAENVPERDVVLECGGRVEIVGDPKDHSATDIIRSRMGTRRSWTTPISPSTEVPEPSKFDRLLVVRTSAMGDIIHALPAVAALRESLPQISIGWVVEERWVELLCSPSSSLTGPRSVARPLADRIHTVNTKGWRRTLIAPDTWRQISGSVRDLRIPRYQIAIDFQGALRSALIARLSGAKRIYGFANPRESVARVAYTERITANRTHVVEQNLLLSEALLGKRVGLPAALLPRDEAAQQECDRYIIEHRIEEFALLNPGAGWGAKQWPAERYGEVAKQLSGLNLRCLINYGPGEQTLAEAAVTSSKGHAKAIQLSLTQLIAFTRRAALFIGGDTGPMHLAAALKVPVVALFGPTDPARNGPFGTTSIVLRNQLSPTSHKRRTQPDPGLSAITEEEVIAAAQQLLERHL
jgi:heptosyltransferase-1